jgi:alanyl-tRNA synthetase
MNSALIREKFLKFFEARGHAIIPSASIVPENDPTTLFTGSGMQPLVPYLLGEPHPKGTRVADSQKCFRAEDIEEVGDNRHTTFFEMLGNWSLGDYFKKEQLPWFFEFLTKELLLDPNNFYVTVFEGSEQNGIPRDDESVAIWQGLFRGVGVDAKVAAMGSSEDGGKRGMKAGERIFFYDAKQNWWSRAGTPENMPLGEPGGPDSEVFYDFATKHDKKFGEHCHPNCDCGRFLEIGNSVFMEYIKTENGFEKLPKQNVDFGGGLERLTASVNNSPDVFRIDSLYSIIKILEKDSGRQYDDPAYTTAFRIIADHMRGAVVMIGNGVLPSNTEQGYFVRRLIRRSVRYADMLGVPEGMLSHIANTISETYGSYYDEVAENLEAVKAAIEDEEGKFRLTLSRGLKQFGKIGEGRSLKKFGPFKPILTVSADDAFTLFSTYGFPIELTVELAGERGWEVDVDGFRRKMKEHQALSRSGAEQKFKGGLADQSEKTVQLHTTHHLLLKALQSVLGAHVKQRGSNITGERLRIDFSHSEKLSDEQKAEVERIVNEKIKEGLPVIKSTLKKEDAEALGAEQEFGQKYPDMVNIYSVGPKGATPEDPKFSEAFSIEFCGGPHVSNTGDIKGVFRIAREKASSAGIRRIRGVLE